MQSPGLGEDKLRGKETEIACSRAEKVKEVRLASLRFRTTSITLIICSRAKRKRRQKAKYSLRPHNIRGDQVEHGLPARDAQKLVRDAPAVHARLRLRALYVFLPVPFSPFSRSPSAITDDTSEGTAGIFFPPPNARLMRPPQCCCSVSLPARASISSAARWMRS